MFWLDDLTYNTNEAKGRSHFEPKKGNILDLHKNNSIPSEKQHHFSEQDQYGLYKAIFNRRDVRGQFLATEIPNDVLSRLLYAAHHAPSVGFM